MLTVGAAPRGATRPPAGWSEPDAVRDPAARGTRARRIIGSDGSLPGSTSVSGTMGSSTLRIRLFGDLELRLGDTPLEPVESTRAVSLLAYLLLHREAPQRRGYLAFLLWPDSREPQARTNLRHALHDLRAALPGPDTFLDVRTRTLQWKSDAPFSLDLAEFDAAITRVRHAAAGEVIGDLRIAVEAYRGDLLPGLYDEWLQSERERVRHAFLEALHRLTILLEERGEYGDAVASAERLVRLDPLREDAHRALMRLYDGRGDRARALHVYHVCAATLQRELGVDPSAATRDVYERLLRSESVRPSPGMQRAVPAVAIGDAAPPGAAVGAVADWPMVGRAEEWARLTGLWLGAEGGHAQFVLVTGEAGAGKSRLVQELRSWCAERGAATAESRSYAAEGALAYGPVVSWLRSAPFEGRLTRLSAPRQAALARLLPELRASSEVAPASVAAERDQRQIFEAAAHTLLSPGTPILLVADELQWSGRETLQFIHYLLRAHPGARVLVVATSRLEDIDESHPLNELLAALQREGRCTQLGIGRLDLLETAALAQGIARDQLSEAEMKRLFDETDGNALFVVEAMRAGWRELEPTTRWTGPRVRSVIASRLARLSDDARGLANVAAVIGREFSSKLLAEAAATNESTLVRGLDELWRRGIVRETETGAYDFSHDKLREVTYAAIGPATRRAHHLGAARALERLHAERPGAVSGQLAAHFERGGAIHDAIAWYERAAEGAQRVYANGEAVRLLERALDLVAQCPPSGERDARELSVLAALPAPIAALSGYSSTRVEQVLARALEVAGKSGAEPAPPIVRGLAITSLARGEFARAQRAGEQLQRLGDHDGDPVLLVESAYILGIAAFWQGELERARDRFEAAISGYEPAQAATHLLRYGLDPRIICLSRLANTLWLLGEPMAAEGARDTALRLAEELRHPHSRAVALVFATMLALDMHDEQGVRRHATALRAVSADAELDAPQFVIPMEMFRAYVSVLDGQAQDGLSRARRTIAEAPAGDPAPGSRAMLLHVLIETCAAANDPRAGLAAADRALQTVGSVRIWEAVVRRRRAEFLESLGAPDSEIDQELDRALDVARRQRARSLEAHAMAMIARRRGARDAAPTIAHPLDSSHASSSMAPPR